MYVTKNGKKYRAWEYVVIDGVQKRISVTMDRDTPQARNKAAKQLEAIKNRPTNDMTYSELVAVYITYQKATCKMSTWTRNKATLERLELTFGKNKKVNEMTSGFITSKLLSKTQNPGTFNEYLKRIKAMFRWAYRNDFIQSSACVDKIKPLKDDRAVKLENKYLEPDELKQVLAAADYYYGPVFEFLALSGLRIGELIALNDEDVTETDIIVNKTYDSRNGVINTPKTTAGCRQVHIQPELQKCIKKIRLNSKEHCLACGNRRPYFVVSILGERLSYDMSNRLFKGLCARLTSKPLTIHALRHTHVSLMAEKVDIEAISRRLGHANSKITRDIYYHVTKKQKEKDNAAFDAVKIFG